MSEIALGGPEVQPESQDAGRGVSPIVPEKGSGSSEGGALRGLFDPRYEQNRCTIDERGRQVSHLA